MANQNLLRKASYGRIARGHVTAFDPRPIEIGAIETAACDPAIHESRAYEVCLGKITPPHLYFLKVGELEDSCSAVRVIENRARHCRTLQIRPGQSGAGKIGIGKIGLKGARPF